MCLNEGSLCMCAPVHELLFVILKVWSVLDKQHQHHRGIFQKYKFLGPSPSPSESKSGQGARNPCFYALQVSGMAHSAFRTSTLESGEALLGCFKIQALKIQTHHL